MYSKKSITKTPRGGLEMHKRSARVYFALAPIRFPTSLHHVLGSESSDQPMRIVNKAAIDLFDLCLDGARKFWYFYEI